MDIGSVENAAHDASLAVGLGLASPASTVRAAVKLDVVRQLGELALVLPSLVNHALEANDRAKYYLTLLQAAATSARLPDRPSSSLHGERLAAGINDTWLDETVALSVSCADDALFVLPRAAEIHATLLGAVGEMLKPFAIAAVEGCPDPSRMDRLRATAPAFASDRVPYAYVEAATSADGGLGDSLHLLVMDAHRALNRLQGEIATESLDGALVYGIDHEDRPLIRSFMSGVHRTAPLKFDHPGLGTTATHVADRLLIQNDVGMTEAHVIVVSVQGLVATVTYTDVHLSRLVYFRALLDRFDVNWSSPERRDGEVGLGAHHLATGRFEAADQNALERYLAHLGSRLVFLIDWNRARKRLAPLVGKKSAIGLLRWAAEEECGHRAFLQLGAERLVYSAVEQAMKVPPPYGTPLREVLGAETTLEVLRFALRATAQGLLADKSHRLIRDEIRVELFSHLHAARSQILEFAADHGSLVVEAGQALRAAVLRLTDEDGDAFVQRASKRAGGWEHRADQIVIATRLAAARVAGGEALANQLTTQDDAIDALEESVFQLTLMPRDGAAAVQPVFRQLVAVAGAATQEHLKALEIARLVLDDPRPEDIQDFLLAIDRVVELEHEADRTDRAARAAFTVEAPDFRTLQVATDVSRAVEDATDALMRSALQLRDHILAEVITR